MRLSVLAVCCALWASCSDATSTAATSSQQPAPLPPAIEHDFGVIPHPERREHDLVLDLSPLGRRCIPLRANLDCSCGRAELRIRTADGSERAIDGSPNPDNAVGPGEVLLVRVTLDTVTKEAVDLPKTTSRGHVVLQPVDDRLGRQRIQWPILVRYGIDAPVALHPFAALDFERVPMSATPVLETTLRGDENHPGMKFLGVESTDPALVATLEPAGDHTRLRVRCQPGAFGHHRAAVGVRTDHAQGYHVILPVTWKVVPDLEVTPMAKISFRANLTRPQTPAEAVGQFVVVTDHDLRRSPEFTVHELVDEADRDAAADFAVEILPIPGQPRRHRLSVRYLGSRSEPFRGRLVLTKNGDEGPFLTIDLAMFQNRDS